MRKCLSSFMCACTVCVRVCVCVCVNVCWCVSECGKVRACEGACVGAYVCKYQKQTGSASATRTSRCAAVICGICLARTIDLAQTKSAKFALIFLTRYHLHMCTRTHTHAYTHIRHKHTHSNTHTYTRTHLPGLDTNLTRTCK